MIKEGLVDEVKSLLDKGYDRNLVSMQGIGAKVSFFCVLPERRSFMKTEKTIWQKSREELFQELSSTPEGLTGAEAARRLDETAESEKPTRAESTKET